MLSTSVMVFKKLYVSGSEPSLSAKAVVVIACVCCSAELEFGSPESPGRHLGSEASLREETENQSELPHAIEQMRPALFGPELMVPDSTSPWPPLPVTHDTVARQSLVSARQYTT